MAKKRLNIFGILILVVPAVFIYFLSSSPSYNFLPERNSALMIGLKHITDKVHICTDEEVRLFLEKESQKSRTHLRKRAAMCGSRERVPLKIIVWLDGRELLNTEYEPSGVRNDGNTFVYERFAITAGEHNIKVVMRDSKKGEENRYDYSLERTLNFPPKRVIVLDFDPLGKTLILS